MPETEIPNRFVGMIVGFMENVIELLKDFFVKINWYNLVVIGYTVSTIFFSSKNMNQTF